MSRLHAPGHGFVGLATAAAPLAVQGSARARDAAVVPAAARYPEKLWSYELASGAIGAGASCG